MKDKLALLLILPVIGIGSLILELGIVIKGVVNSHKKNSFKSPLLTTVSSKTY